MPDQKYDAVRTTASLVSGDPSIPDETKVKILDALQAIPTPLQTDRWIYRLVVCFLGLTVIGTVAGGFIITGKSAQSIPEGLIALGSAAVGALAGLLAPSPGSR
jgi:hypothetical protein